MNLQSVKDTQNIDVNLVAYYFVANFYKTAYEDIQLPKPTYRPM